MTRLTARPVISTEYKPIVQPISGYVTGYSKANVYRVEVSMGLGRVFESRRTYKSRALAAEAAERIERLFR
jgi:hypothetical protein